MHLFRWFILRRLAQEPLRSLTTTLGIALGVAVVVPLAFAAAGRAGPRPAQQIAGVATIAYGAGMVAPATIGGIAQAASLPVSFLVVAALAALVTAGAGTLAPSAAA